MMQPGGTALVTGASTGIGASYADRLAKRGYDLIVVARDRARLEVLAARLQRETGRRVEVLRADLTSSADLGRLETRLRDDASIELLVNNAGASLPRPVVGEDVDRMEAVIRLNVVALTRLAAVAATAFAARGRGTIVNLSSSVALTPELYGAVYGATKAFILSFSLGLQAEIAPRGVRLQVVLPGAVRTELWGRAGRSVDEIDPERLMEPDELVDAALAGLDEGEVVTIPSLADAGAWHALTAARLALGPQVSRAHAAPRYGLAGTSGPL